MSVAPEPEPYQSLYRRYRPQTFAAVRGQEHVTRALRNAVRDGKVAHAYLFSGPRGTGKTSTARILAMALNCEHPVDGEPDGTCASCVAIRQGSSMDVHELDAASNRRLEEMRELLSRVALGTPGRWKVYIIDEVHQLTNDASSALLKTLEEPPGHVVFVLATTDPQRVLPTIRSRTQHFEFRLLGSDTLGDLLRDVNSEAALGVSPEAIDLVVRRGHGSARDALSVLDQVAAAGTVDDEEAVVGEIVEAVTENDVGRVLVAVAEAMSSGRDPRRLASDILAHLRNGFVATQARGLVLLPDAAVVEVEEQARRLGLARLVRGMELLGQASADMRDSVDPRITLEVALVRLTAPAADDPAALLERVERLERMVASGGVTAAGAPALAPPAPTGAAGDPEPLPASPPNGPPAAGGPGAVPARPGVEAAAGLPPAPPTQPASSVGGPAGRPPGAGCVDPRGSARAARPPSAPSAADIGGRRAPVAAPGGGSAHASGSFGGPRWRAAASGPALHAGARRGGPDAACSRRPRPARGGPGYQPRPRHRRVPGHRPSLPSGPPAAAATLPSRDELTTAWGDAIVGVLRPGVKMYFSAGRFVDADGPAATFALPDKILLGRADGVRGEVEQALAAHFGRPVPLRLVLDPGAAPVDRRAPEPEPGSPDDDSENPAAYRLDELDDAEPAVMSAEQRVLLAFPGAEEVEL